MALFNCNVGDFAVIRYCHVITYGEESERNGHLHRPIMEFEKEKNRAGKFVYKYDVVEIETLAPTFEGSMKRPPYMAPVFGKPGEFGLHGKMQDAEFF
jgi:hypothetical protein